MIYEELTILKIYKKIIATCMLITPDFIRRASQSEESSIDNDNHYFEHFIKVTNFI